VGDTDSPVRLDEHTPPDEARRELCDVALVGLWHLGSVAAAAWTSSGRAVCAWDPAPELAATVAGGRGAVAEPGLDDALRSALDNRLLRVVGDVEHAIAGADVTHLAYDTAVGPSGRHDDPRLDVAVRLFAEAAPDGALLLVSSQLPVGTARGWRELLRAEDRGLLLAYVPENLRLGRALDDFLRPERLVVGADDDEAYDRAAELLKPFSASPVRVGLTAAEMVKHATNAYLALCIAFANDLAWLSRHAGADPGEVAAGLRADPRVSPSAPLRPGPAFSGATLTRDLVTLAALGEECGRPELFAAVTEANERHSWVALTWLEEALGSLDGARIAVAGLTYKPGTSTLRDSLPLRLVARIVEGGARVSAWDPAAEEFDAPSGVTRAASLGECVDGADALAVLTALPELEHVDWRALRPGRRLVVDGCMGIDRSAVEAAGWDYLGFARA
jgi:UDPglucose 6-dehydrogenase